MSKLVTCFAVTAAICCTASAPPALSAQEDTVLHRLLAEHSYPVHLSAGVPSGPGWELLLREGRKADFFMLGEAHGVATIPVLTRYLFAQLVPVGYERLVIEVSPRQAAELEQRIRTEPDSLVPWAMRQGMRIPFYSWKEEAELLRAAVAAVPKTQTVLWGLDQEFAGSSEAAFVRLGELARTPEQRRLAKEFRGRAERGFAGMKGGAEPPFLAAAQEADFQRLRQGFVGNAQAIDLIRELEQSADIYQSFRARRVYYSNDTRERLMKRNFVAYLNHLPRQGANAPKMLFKFGADHLFRGQKETKNLSLGNFLSELAISRGKESFNVLALPGAGSWREIPQSGQPKRVPNDALASDDLEPLRQHVGPGGWTVIDLRPLRDPLLRKQIRVADEFARIIWGYDAVVVLPSSPPAISAPQQ